MILSNVSDSRSHVFFTTFHYLINSVSSLITPLPWLYLVQGFVFSWLDSCKVLWPPDVKSRLTGKDRDAGENWGQKEKGATEDKMVGWHHWLKGHEFKITSGDSEGQGSLVCCSSWDCKELDITTTNINVNISFSLSSYVYFLLISLHVYYLLGS